MRLLNCFLEKKIRFIDCTISIVLINLCKGKERNGLVSMGGVVVKYLREQIKELE